MFVVDKEAKIRSLFVMPSAKSQRPLVKGTEHSIRLHVAVFSFRKDHRIGNGWDGSLKIFTILSLHKDIATVRFNPALVFVKYKGIFL